MKSLAALMERMKKSEETDGEVTILRDLVTLPTSL